MAPNRLQFSLAEIFSFVTIAALLAALVAAFPESLAEGLPAARWLALANELTLIVMSISIGVAIGTRTGYDFAIGFAVFAAVRLTLAPLLNLGISPYGLFLDSSILWRWLGHAGSESAIITFYFGRVGLLFFWGAVGGFWATWLRRRRHRCIAPALDSGTTSREGK